MRRASHKPKKTRGAPSVVVGDELVPELREQRKGVVGVEVLKLKQAPRPEEVRGRFHELLKRTVLFGLCLGHRFRRASFLGNDLKGDSCFGRAMSL